MTMKTETRTYGVKFTTGEIIKVRTWSHDAAKVKGQNQNAGKAIDSVWVIGQYWDENGNAR
jgi:hypothetical protein